MERTEPDFGIALDWETGETPRRKPRRPVHGEWGCDLGEYELIPDDLSASTWAKGVRAASGLGLRALGLDSSYRPVDEDYLSLRTLARDARRRDLLAEAS